MVKIPRIKRHHQTGFTTVNNEFLRDQGLSLSERGLLITMLSLPDGWNMSGRGLAAILPDGRDKIFSTLKKLEQRGYLKRDLIRENGHFVDTEYQFCDLPVFKEENAIKEKKRVERKALKEKRKKEQENNEKTKRAQRFLLEIEEKEGKENVREGFESLKGKRLREFVSEKVFEKEKIKEEIEVSDADFQKIVEIFSAIIENEPEKRDEFSLAGPLDILFLQEKIKGSEHPEPIIKNYFLEEGVFLR